ncbi:uncharacterized protein FA14DRAFT_155993 [Meira miltonrushii]|uniref:DUF3074 domain-containing protein n=1 Tax=Meira miltonrushii TaxID=1280837 RepID=A0A316V6Z3_9BASI|nr:uncharacterized protein FA14DRAFT_155993 [Meira miltonrushii]PWN33296.1 hypothetical protein FA14DRAFT_155993 [Meira miltonrushii]
MTAPKPEAECPLTPVAIPLSDLLNEDHKLKGEKFNSLVRQALNLYRSNFTAGRTYKHEHDTEVGTLKLMPGEQSQRTSKCAWHARKSIHDPATQSHKLSYKEFHSGLFVDHPVKERQYIHEILRYDRIQEVHSPTIPESAAEYIADVRADVWVTEYKLPMITSNRDFLEMFLTIDLKPHANPLSSQHIDAIIASLNGDAQAEKTDEESDSTQKRSSAINIQLPVSTSAFEPQANFVRAFYSSVEIIRELEGDKTEWWMAVQSDSAGRVPLMFQEMAMPSKISPDVPSFIGWAVEQKKKGESV